LSCIVVSTSPPFIGLSAAIANIARRAPVVFWAMDLNPDQLLALGKLRKDDFAARVLAALTHFIHRRSAAIVALDGDMRARIHAREDVRAPVSVIPPWSASEKSTNGDASAHFRDAHGMTGKFVVMYSGNHSQSNPLDTLLQAAIALKNHPIVRFAFVGGGTGKRAITDAITAHGLSNVISLPYQARETLLNSLASADVHVVSLGDAMCGVIHPSKVYSAMAVGRPILYFGPPESSIAQMIAREKLGWTIRHGDSRATIDLLEDLAINPAELNAMGERAATLFSRAFQPTKLRALVADVVEAAIKRDL
jgi:colanic acid biosynthesis glycosyl transferase WcaI